MTQDVLEGCYVQISYKYIKIKTEWTARMCKYNTQIKTQNSDIYY